MGQAQLIRRQMTDPWTWVASSVVGVPIESAGVITRIVLRIPLVASGTMVAAGAPDGIWRIMDALTLKGKGSVNYFSMGDQQISRMLHLLNLNDKIIPGGRQALATTNQLLFVLHFGSRPFDQYGRPNPFDLTAFVPGFNDKSMRLEWLTTANDVMDAAITISSAKMYATIYEVLGTQTDIQREMANQNVQQAMFPISSYYSYPHTGAFSDVSHDISLPSGNFLRRVAIMVQDHTATRPLRADDLVTEVAVKLPVGNQRSFQDSFPAMVIGQGVPQTDLIINQGVTGGTPIVGAGFATVDFRQQAHWDYGIDTRDPKFAGAFKLGVTIGAGFVAGDKSFYWFDELRPYSW
jgi:hypothetical protein